MSVVAWSAACRPKAGQSVSGDTYIFEERPNGVILAGVIDGLGGGVEAARAAQLAADILRQYPDDPLTLLMQRSHTELHHSRGAVIGLLRLDTVAHKAWYIGVGNIGIFVQSARSIKPISKNGIIGARLPSSLLELSYMYDPGDTFVLYSDGISSRWSFDSTLDLRASPEHIAETVMATHGKQTDDVTVLVVRP